MKIIYEALAILYDQVRLYRIQTHIQSSINLGVSGSSYEDKEGI